MERLTVGCNDKLAQWENEAIINAGRAFKAGRSATLVEYPSGLQMMRFAEPYKDYGMHFEVRPEVWAAIVANNGNIVL